MAADFFHGATPWLYYRSPRKYFTYIDASFHTFLTHYKGLQFWTERDVSRIYSLEKKWLEGAERVYVSSQWAVDEAQKAYGMELRNMQVVGIGGHLAWPEGDAYTGGKVFLAIMTDFSRKGGPLCADAFQLVKASCPDASLLFVGERPPADILSIPGIGYAGYLRKNVNEELMRLTSLFSSAFALVLPSGAETTPIVIIEAGYFGCPAVATSSFGIPEMIVDGRTGILIRGQLTAASVASAMLRLCRAGGDYFAMRAAVREHFIKNFTWKSVVARMTSCWQ